MSGYPGVARVVVARTVEEALDHGPESLYVQDALLVIEHPQWTADMAFLTAHLEATERAFKQPYFTREPGPKLRATIDKALGDATLMFEQLYPHFNARPGRHTLRSSWRPMITRNEPMHYDTYQGEHPLVTSYINISPSMRHYNIGPTLRQLCEREPAAVRAIYRKYGPECLYRLREMKDGPLTRCQRVRVEFAPGAIWFFNAKTVAHEVVYGEGALGASWEVAGVAEMPPEILRRMVG
jgi:hypothetical protein